MKILLVEPERDKKAWGSNNQSCGLLKVAHITRASEMK